MSGRDPGSFIARGLAVLVAAVLVAVLVGGGLAVRNRLFFDHTPAFRASERLLTAVRTRPLSAAELDDALALWECGERVVEMRLNAIIPLALDRAPDQRPAVVAHLTRLAADPSDPARQTRAGFLLRRLTGPPPNQP